jgi:hypothetical protein
MRNIGWTLLLCLFAGVATGKESSSLVKCEWYEFYCSDGSECFIINVENSSEGAGTVQNVKATSAAGSTTKPMKHDQGRTYTCRYTSIEVHETVLEEGGEISWSTKKK